MERELYTMIWQELERRTSSLPLNAHIAQANYNFISEICFRIDMIEYFKTVRAFVGATLGVNGAKVEVYKHFLYI